ncbi:hypothetical protein PVNG_02203 [Plasmodium vivax North Korean]|uniref:Uncharacterized protein n=1 Tax=Plasmodium vivax North Korean TaxID=1035514 RepID=A0A0J9TTS7_PLAVI|nr:hypothetical protein PVNG_02203 [Plasmodium vivax North Korean]
METRCSFLLFVFVKYLMQKNSLNIIKQPCEYTYGYIKINIYVFYLYFQYSFLDNVWSKYNQFDNSVDDDVYKYMYSSFCDPLMNLLGENKEEHKNFCLKLVRNLGRYPPDSPFFDPSPANCKILDYWIFNSVRKHKISDKIITECFADYKTYMGNISKFSRCSYHSYYDNYEEPKNIIILDIFQSNMDTARNIVTRENNKIDFRMQKYICECVKIYKEMNRNYCPISNSKSDKSNKTCEILNTFKETYKSFLSSAKQKNYKIPSLDSVEAEYLTMCPQDNPSSKLTSESNRILPVLAPLYGVRDGDTDKTSTYEGAMNYTADFFTPSTEANVENHGNPMSSTVSTAVGTVAGTSSILALLYKVNKEFHINV